MPQEEAAGINVGINAGSAADLLAQRLASIQAEASESSQRGQPQRGQPQSTSGGFGTGGLAPFGGPDLSENNPSAAAVDRAAAGMGSASMPPLAGRTWLGPAALLSRDTFDQPYLQNLANTGQSGLLASFLTASPKQQEAQLAAAYQSETARYQAEVSSQAEIQQAAARQPPLLPAEDAAPLFKRMPSFLEELAVDPHEDLFQQNLSSRHAARMLTETPSRAALTDRFAALAEEAAPYAPEDDPLPDPADLGYGDGEYANRRVLTQAPFGAARGQTRFQKSVGRLKALGSRAASNIQEDWNDKSGYGKLNYGYAAEQLAGEAGQLYGKTNSGNYLTPEEKETAGAGLLPGVGAIAGTLIGSIALPGAGSWVGGMVGAGIGTAAEGIVGANEAREQTTREAAERLAASLGLAADSVSGFKAQIEATGASVQQVSQGLAALQSSGPGVGAAAIGGVGRSALSGGEFYAADTADTAKFLSSSPALAPLSQMYRTQGELTKGQYEGVAGLALAEGDPGEFNVAMRQASTATLNTDPEYQGAAKRLEADKGNWGLQARHWFDNLAVNKWMDGTYGKDTVYDGDYIAGAQKQMDDRKKALGTESSADANKFVDEFAALNRGRQGLIDAGLNTRLGEAGFSTAEARGASAGVLRGLLPGLETSFTAASAADGQIITTDTGLMNALTKDTDPTGSLRAGYQNLINSAKADQAQYPLKEAEMRRSVFGAGVEEEEAGFGLSALRGTLSGRSAKSLEVDYDRQADYLSRTAEDPSSPLSPAERSRMEQGAVQMRYGAKMGAYTQALNTDDLSIEQAAVGTQQAKNFGTAGDVYSAQTTEIDRLTAKMHELTAQMSAGGLSADDFTAKMRERTQAEGQAAQVMAQRRDDRLNAGDSLASSQMTIDTAGLPRAVRSGGAGAVDFGEVNRDFGRVFAADQARIDEFKEGDPRRKAAQAKLATDLAGSRDYEEGLAEASPLSAKERTENILAGGRLDSARHAFKRAMEAPYMDGSPENDPMTRGREVEGEVGLGLARNERNAAAETAQRSRLQGQRGADGKPLWDDLAEEHYAGDMDAYRQKREGLLDEKAGIEAERRTGFLKMLPEMIAGSPGQGTLSGVLPTAGQSAYYSSNPFVTGSFGAPDHGLIHDGGGHTAQPGGVAGAFLAASGIDAKMAGGSDNSQVVAELKRLNANIERMTAIGGRSAAVAGSPAGYNQSVNMALPGFGYGGGGR